mmetsp:Transcript_5488/g.8345  ORF Transcript_5488/g.8345 Transcript_5488/m.8345 type:complete len:198 (-) Transcript_5488:543-1136(-)
MTGMRNSSTTVLVDQSCKALEATTTTLEKTDVGRYVVHMYGGSCFGNLFKCFVRVTNPTPFNLQPMCRRVPWIRSYQWKSARWDQSWPYCGTSNCHNFQTSVFKNNYDNRFYFYFPSGSYALTGFGGKHSNYHEDRVWWFYIAQVTKTATSCNWTPYVNDWDASMHLNLASNQWIAGIDSYHDNHREDRRFKYYVCS